MKRFFSELSVYLFTHIVYKYSHLFLFFSFNFEEKHSGFRDTIVVVVVVGVLGKRKEMTGDAFDLVLEKRNCSPTQ